MRTNFQGQVNSLLSQVGNIAILAKGVKGLNKTAEATSKATANNETANKTVESPSPQEIAKQRAEISLANAIEAKKGQKERALSNQERLEALRASGRSIV